MLDFRKLVAGLHTSPLAGKLESIDSNGSLGAIYVAKSHILYLLNIVTLKWRFSNRRVRQKQTLFETCLSQQHTDISSLCERSVIGLFHQRWFKTTELKLRSFWVIWGITKFTTLPKQSLEIRGEETTPTQGQEVYTIVIIDTSCNVLSSQ